MAGDSRLSARFGIDSTDFKNGIVAINRELKLVETGFRATASTMGDWSNTATGLEARMKALTKSIELQKEKTEALHYKFEDLAKVHGANSVEAQKAGIEFNQEAAKLGKLQTELGHTENSLKQLQNKTSGVRGTFKDFGTQVDKLGKQVPALGTAFSLLTNPISLAVAGLGTFVAISKKAIKETVDYNKQVREMMQLTGLSAEETSRLIQVGDDWGLEMGTIRGALELMNKKGITPSIDNLAKIADEYVNATDKSAFMEAATKKYGKSFGDLIPILAKGGNALRDQAKSIKDNMLATDKSIANSRKWEVALDDLGDAVQGLEYTLGNDFIPILVDTIQTLTGTYDASEHAADGISTLDKAFGGLNAGFAGLKEGANILAFIGALIGAMFSRGGLSPAKVRELQQAFFGVKDAIEEVKTAADPTATAVDALAMADGRLNDELRDAENDLLIEQYAQQLADAKKAADDAAVAIQTATRRMGELNDYINGTLGPNEKKFTDTQGDLNTKMGEIQGEIDQAIKDGYDPLGKKVLDLKGNYGELKTQYDENAKAHEEDTKRIILGILAQQMAAMGFSDTTAFAKIAMKWGLIDEATMNAMISTGKAINWLRDHPGDYAGFERMMSGVVTDVDGVTKAADTAAGALDKIVGQHEVGIHVTVTGDTIPTIPQYKAGQPYIGGQHGLNMMVPQGFPNDSFPVLASSGEQIIIIPPGERFGKSLASIQQLIIQSIKGLNIQPSPAVPGGGGINQALYPSAAPIYITIQGTPEKEMEKRRQARYVAEEIQRRQS